MASATGGAISNLNGSVAIGHGAVVRGNNATAIATGDPKATRCQSRSEPRPRWRFVFAQWRMAAVSLLDRSTAQSGFGHVIGRRATLTMDTATVSGNVVMASCPLADPGCGQATGAAIMAEGGGLGLVRLDHIFACA